VKVLVFFSSSSSFETGPCFVPQAGLELAVFLLTLPSVRITGFFYHIWLVLTFN
jgi:hypothetical protein